MFAEIHLKSLRIAYFGAREVLVGFEALLVALKTPKNFTS